MANKKRNKSPSEATSTEPLHRALGLDDSLRVPIVGVGASAGGLEAVEELLQRMPVDTGMAFVIVMHHPPDRASLLPELLRRTTGMPVRLVEDPVTVVANQVYVGAPGTLVSVDDGRLVPVPAERGSLHWAIDHFLRSLALAQHEYASCIILSGSGSDGTIGLKAIKGEGGMAMVQDAKTARYGAMPRSAEATGMVDYVLAPADMPQQLLHYAKARLPSEPAPEAEREAGEVLERIFSLLHNRTGHDFSNYKLTTLRRRIERRMHVHQVQQPKEYLSYLRENPHEIDLLFQELLICVTSFFRDPDAYAALERDVLPDLLRRAEGGALRLWVPGCATGEEVYSLAILVREAIERQEKRFEVQIFGTDLDAESIARARQGIYPAGIAADVSPERLERFFVPGDHTYRLKRELRDTAVFACHNLIKEPPFGKLDLLSCRNLLIYLTVELQRRLLPVFHYALKPDGVLLLGPSESITGFEEMFSVTDKRWKIFQRREVATQPLPAFQVSSDRGRPPVIVVEGGAQPRSLTHLVQGLLLERYTPTCALVDPRGEVLYIHGKPGDFLEPATGRPSYNLLHMARENLRANLGALLRRGAGEEEAISETVRVKGAAGPALVRLTARRLGDPEPLRGLLLVTFETVPEPPRPKEDGAGHPPSRLSELEQELRSTQETLQSTVEELETSNEELKSTNEELQSTNEELQSINEELETSKEELQSLNEELQTVNAELQSKVEELSRTNDDMANLLNSTDIATLFLDPRLHIKRFTERARHVFNLIDSDVGRPLADMASNLVYEELIADSTEVLRSLSPKEGAVRLRDGAWRLMRITPYRTGSNVIDGIVITLVDIDLFKRAQEALARGQET